jgi:transposase
MARYSQAFKQPAVAQLLPPESSPVETVSREIGVSVDTLDRWSPRRLLCRRRIEPGQQQRASKR